ncbi:MAG: PTS transporter subunit IIC [Chloroflexota bacterium]
MEALFTEIGKLIANNTVSVPLLLVILSLLVGMKPGKAIRAGLVTSVALIGLWTILTLFMNTINPVATAIGERMGAGARFDLADVGWTARFAAGFTLIGLSYVGIGILLNLVLVLVGWTKTLSIEFIGPILANSTIGYAMYLVTGSYWLGLLASTLIFILSWKLNDWQTPMVEKFFGYKNIALITVGVNEVGLLAWPISWLLDKIPGLKESKFTAEWVNEKFGVVGEPMFIGGVLGIILGIVAGFPLVDVLVLGATLAACLNLMPRMIGILMEGLVPIQDSVRKWLTEHAKGREIYIGMDPALGTGHPAVLATATIMVPITLAIALLMPGNRLMPMADLAVMVFTVLFCVVMNRGDILRSVITSTIVMIFVVWFANLDAPYLSMVLADQNLIEKGAIVGQLTSGGAPYAPLFAWIYRLLGFGV